MWLGEIMCYEEKKKKKDVTEAARVQEGIMAYKTCEKKKKVERSCTGNGITVLK